MRCPSLAMQHAACEVDKNHIIADFADILPGYENTVVVGDILEKRFVSRHDNAYNMPAAGHGKIDDSAEAFAVAHINYFFVAQLAKGYFAIHTYIIFSATVIG